MGKIEAATQDIEGNMAAFHRPGRRRKAVEADVLKWRSLNQALLDAVDEAESAIVDPELAAEIDPLAVDAARQWVAHGKATQVHLTKFVQWRAFRVWVNNISGDVPAMLLRTRADQLRDQALLRPTTEILDSFALTAVEELVSMVVVDEQDLRNHALTMAQALVDRVWGVGDLKLGDGTWLLRMCGETARMDAVNAVLRAVDGPSGWLPVTNEVRQLLDRSRKRLATIDGLADPVGQYGAAVELHAGLGRELESAWRRLTGDTRVSDEVAVIAQFNMEADRWLEPLRGARDRIVSIRLIDQLNKITPSAVDAILTKDRRARPGVATTRVQNAISAAIGTHFHRIEDCEGALAERGQASLYNRAVSTGNEWQCIAAECHRCLRESLVNVEMGMSRDAERTSLERAWCRLTGDGSVHPDCTILREFDQAVSGRDAGTSTPSAHTNRAIDGL